MNFKTMFEGNIKELAPVAVKYVEDNFEGDQGIIKKEKATEFIYSHLPIPIYLIPFKFFIKKALKLIVSDAIEKAVKILKSKLQLISE